jgi:uncharacterized coiled-coil DUF342 family protein
MQEYMFQLERKKGKILGEYLPEIRSYANKNYQPDPKYEKKKDSDFASYKPADWEAKNIIEEIQTLKEKHEEYHVKMDKALKAKNTVREESVNVKKELEGTVKEL